MTLYTGKGDDGKMQIFGCDQRLSKTSAVAEALGAFDEVSSLLGWCKVRAFAEERGEPLRRSFATEKDSPRGIGETIEEIQNKLFIVQAEVAGASKKLPADVVMRLEEKIAAIEKEIPPIKSFIVPGGTELSAILDVARTISRRAERRAIAVAEEGTVKIDPIILAFLNRLSSLLFALARLANHRAGLEEQKPEY